MCLFRFELASIDAQTTELHSAEPVRQHWKAIEVSRRKGLRTPHPPPSVLQSLLDVPKYGRVAAAHAGATEVGFQQLQGLIIFATTHHRGGGA